MDTNDNALSRRQIVGAVGGGLAAAAATPAAAEGQPGVGAPPTPNWSDEYDVLLA
jgi:hypothetical protein